MAAKKKKKTTKPYGNKTKFVLGLSRDLSAKQVVEEAKKNGITITEAHVYKIRSTAKAKGGKGPGRPAKSAPRGRKAVAAKGRASSAGRASSGAGQSKRDFVLGFGSDTPASEILRKAKEQGIGLSKAYLYTIRSSGGASQKRGRPVKAAAASKGRASAAKATKASFRKGSRGGANSLETQFLDAAMDLGLAKATELLSRLRTRAKSY
jgi:type III secretion system FlhB-like substrate exporter